MEGSATPTAVNIIGATNWAMLTVANTAPGDTLLGSPTLSRTSSGPPILPNNGTFKKIRPYSQAFSKNIGIAGETFKSGGRRGLPGNFSYFTTLYL